MFRSLTLSHLLGGALALQLLAMSAWASPIPSNKPANYPGWWFERNVIVRLNPAESAPIWPSSYPVPDDFAVLNQGQLKNIASAAAVELNGRLVGGSGSSINDLLVSWGAPSATRDDYAAVNQGQLKTVAKLFYDRLFAERFVMSLPWSPSTSDDDNYAVANIGQAKNLFSFDLVGFDDDLDRMRDSWEQQIVDADPNDDFTAISEVFPEDDFDGDGLSNWAEYLGGTDPTDFYNGQLPLVSIVSGNDQGDLAGITLPNLLRVEVKNTQGVKAESGSVVFSITSGTGGTLAPSGPVPIDAQGSAAAALTLPTNAPVGTVVGVKASVGSVAGNGEVSFIAKVKAMPTALGKLSIYVTGSGIECGWTDPGVTVTYVIEQYDQASNTWIEVGTSSTPYFFEELPEESEGGVQARGANSSDLQKDTIYLRRARILGAATGAMTEVQAFVINPDENGDTDGLSNGEEVDAGYYSELLANGTMGAGTIKLGGNPLGWVGPDPKLPDTDTDGVNDDLDGWANNPDIKVPRLPDTNYAVIELPSLNRPEDNYFDGYADSWYVPYQINDECEILAVQYYYIQSVDWHLVDLKTLGVTTFPANFFPNTLTIPEIPNYHMSRILNDSGTICGNVWNSDPPSVTPATWAGTGQASILPRYTPTHFAGAHDIWYNDTAQAISNSGEVVGTINMGGTVTVSVDPPLVKFVSDSGGVKWGAPEKLGSHTTADGNSLSGGDTFSPVNINSSGIVVGSYATCSVINGTLQTVASGDGIYDGGLQKLPSGCIVNSITESPSSPMIFGFRWETFPSPYQEQAVPKVWVKKDGSWAMRDVLPGVMGPGVNGNDRIEMLGWGGLIRNGKFIDLNERLGNDWGSPSIGDINNLGIGVGGAVKLKENGIPIPSAQRKSYSVAYVPSEYFLDNKNKVYNPKTEALGVSHWVTNVDLAPGSSFSGTSPDPQNFRLGATSLDPAATSVAVTLKIKRENVVIETRNYNLTAKSGTRFRSDFLRLVTSDEDLAAAPTNQAIKVQLGDTLEMSYDIFPGKKVSCELSVGRPKEEQYNGSDQKKFDIREVKLNVVVFKNAAGQPCATESQVDKDIKDANELLAQIGVRAVQVGIRVEDPKKIADDYYYIPGREPGTHNSVYMNEDEVWALSNRDGDPETIDVMYVEAIVDQKIQGYPRLCRAGTSYPKRNYGSDGGWLVLCTGLAPSGFIQSHGSGAAGGGKPCTLAHELMHLLLNSAHRDEDTSTALLHPSTSPDTKRVDANKRIAPYNEDLSLKGKWLGISGSGEYLDSDTVVMRRYSELLW